MSIDRSVLNDRRPRRVAYITSVAVVGLAAFIFGRTTAPEAVPPSQDAKPAVPSDPGLPTPDDPGVASASRSGAVSAATGFARSMGSVRASDEGYVDQIEAIAAPSWRAEARRLAHNGLDFVTNRYGPNGEISFVPIRYRVSRFSRSRATVQVWGVVLSSGPPGRIDNTWGVSTIELVYLDGEWRARGGASEPGPTPELQESNDFAPVSALEEFSEYGRGPQP